MTVILVIILYLCYIFNLGVTQTADCSDSTHAFLDTDIGASTIDCVTTGDFDMYSDNRVEWFNALTMVSLSLSNSLFVSGITTEAGIYELVCNFTINSTDPNSDVTTCDVTVAINKLPTLSITPQAISITYPSPDTLECIADNGFDSPMLSWEDSSGIQLSNNFILNFNTDENLKIGDDKEFVCVSMNSAGTITVNITITIEPNPPTVTISPSSSFSVNIGGLTELTCSATSPLLSTAYTYTWSIDGTALTSGTNGVSIMNNVLTISNTRSINDGLYTCMATIFNSDPGMDSTQLTVMSPPPLVRIDRDPALTTYVAFNTLVLTCEVTPQPFNDNLSIVITWSTTSGAVSGTNGDTLTFNSLSLSDVGDIRCEATVGNSVAAFDTYTLAVVPPAPTVLLMFSPTKTPDYGSTVTLTCDVTDSSGSTQNFVFEWYKDSSLITSETSKDLILSSVTTSDTGNYSCSASIQGSNTTVSDEVLIEVYISPPVITPVTISEEPVIEGVTTGTLDCNTSGIPPPTVTWLDRFGGSYDNPLNLATLNNSVNGTFTCNATNVALPQGVSDDIIIIIIPPTPILEVSLGIPNPVLGFPFSLSCEVTSTIPFGRSIADYSFSWETIPPTTQVADTQTYSFTAMLETNNTQYMCNSTVAGSESGAANSSILMLQTVPSITSFDIPNTIYIGIPYFIPCEATGIPVPTITVTNQQGNVGDLNSYVQSDNGTTEIYTCFVENIHGKDNTTKTFNIIQPTITVEFVSLPSTVVQGSKFILNCSVTTNPSISLAGTTYVFKMNGTKIDETPIYSDDRSSAAIFDVVFRSTIDFTCTVSIPSGEITAEETLIVPELPTVDPLLLGAVGVSLLVFIMLCSLISLVFCMIICCIRQRYKKDKSESGGTPYFDLEPCIGSNQTSFSYPIPVATYSETYEQLLEDGQHKLKEQYQQLTTIKGTTEEARKNINSTKNRYPDVLAYDHSRVIISKNQGTDYINANYMDGFGNTSNAYIGAQGPLGPAKIQAGPSSNTGAATPPLDTVNDFWRMIWEQNITTIVMLTNLIENNRIKCALYWPDDTQTYSRIRVRKIEESRFCDYVIRKFSIQRIQVRTESVTRQVTQFHFVAWPDHGVPLFPIAMIQFVKLVRAFINQTEDGTNAPTLVHCSAGVGRTGTFICLDVILQQLAAVEKSVDIWKETSRLRIKRNYMIQEYLQYEFVHQAINEHIQFGDTECSAADFPKMVAHLHEVTDENPYKVGMSRLEIEFRKLQLRVIQTQHSHAKLNENAGKNRFINTMPFDSNRVKLNPLPGIVGSDYINGSYIDSDKTHWAFIATQGPLKSTMEDFCRMLIEHNSNVIIMLSENTEDKTEDYFSFSQTHYGPFHIQTTKKHLLNDYIHREMIIRVDNENITHQLHHFQLTKPLAPSYSLKDCAKALLSLITGVTVTLQPDETKKGPMVVHCGTGNGMTGVFIAVYIILQRLEYEDRVDVFNTVKRLRMQRVAMVQSPDQYDLCYKSVMEYLQSSP
ncbi:Receptor-type tyrosine-protein phosphatase F-like [Oopsacas minuta]|uniref:protein-tyrosine-phosphatase n=1 Tax=Oopsacas minuta TaxID=111878 RepID=A0AAV7JCZ1_9METZ|nr:Receptor-type tyrosine-protein phosphatase F-like [Oopsacas minuta]